MIKFTNTDENVYIFENINEDMNLRQILNNSKIGLAEKLNYVKNNEKPSRFLKFFESNKMLYAALSHNLFPNNLNKIKLNDPYAFTDNFEKEFEWVCVKVLVNISTIKDFFNYKNIIDINFLLENYEDVQQNLDEIRKRFGYSLWMIEKQLHLAEESIGSNENWQLLSQYLKSIDNPFYEFCITSSSKRIEKGISFESFINQFQNDIDLINAYDFIKDFFVFNNLKLANYIYHFEDLRSVIYVSNIFSLIDQYLILIDVIIYNVNKNNTSLYPLFSKFIEKLVISEVNDSRLNNLYNILSDEQYIIKYNNTNEIISIIELYYTGRYKEALEEAKSYLTFKPLEFEIYEIYVKSQIQLDQVEQGTGITFVDELSNNLYHFLNFNNESEKFGRILLKMCLKYMNFNIGMQIMGFMSEIDNSLNENINYSLYSTYNSAKLLESSTHKQKLSQKYLEFNSYNFYQLKKIYYNINDRDLELYKSTNELQILIAKIVYNYSSNDYKAVIDLIHTHNLIQTPINYNKEKITFYLYNSYLQENLIADSLNLFGNIMFDSKTFYFKINYYNLYVKAFSNSEEYKYASHIDAVILYSLYNSEYDLYEILDEYIEQNDLDINEIYNISSFLSAEKAIYFLNKICTVDTIKYYFNQVQLVEELRLKILDRLIELDTEDRQSYLTEISEINRNMSVRKVIKEVNKGRLYVDVAKLKERLVEKYHDDFNRLLRIVAENSKGSLISFNPTKPRNWERSLREVDEVYNNKYDEAGFIAFKNIYYDVRENFLFSKEYGLDSCLSTRIRHGALKNQIRSVFENLNLVTTKLEDEYIESDYWSSRITDELTNQIVQEKIKLFSQNIDNLNQYLVDDVIQITHEKINDKPAGFFSYTSNDDILFDFYTTYIEYLKTTEDTVEVLLTDLTHFTNFTICSSIEKYFDTKLYLMYKEFILDFINDLSKMNLPNDLYLLDNLNKSMTDLQNCFEDISDWFFLDSSSSGSLLLLEDIINASFELTNSLYKNVKINPIINLNFKEVGGYSSLIYVFNILFSNAITHSNNGDEIDITVEVNLVDEKYVRIDIKNNYKDLNFDVVNEKLLEVKNNWKDFQNIDRSNVEGESGFHKIKRIMIYEAKCITDKFEYGIDDEYITISLFLVYQKPAQNENPDN